MVSTPYNCIFDYFFVSSHGIVFSPSMSHWIRTTKKAYTTLSDFNKEQFHFSYAVRVHFQLLALQVQTVCKHVLNCKYRSSKQKRVKSSIQVDLKPLGEDKKYPITVAGLVDESLKVEFYICFASGISPNLAIVEAAFNSFYNEI